MAVTLEKQRPFLTLGKTTIWRWYLPSEFVSHDVRTDGFTLEWDVWAGDKRIGTMRRYEYGRAKAAEFVARVRHDGHDTLIANRMLRKRGYAGAQHVERADCNCDGCNEDRIKVRGYVANWSIERLRRTCAVWTHTLTLSDDLYPPRRKAQIGLRLAIVQDETKRRRERTERP